MVKLFKHDTLRGVTPWYQSVATKCHDVKSKQPSAMASVLGGFDVKAVIEQHNDFFKTMVLFDVMNDLMISQSNDEDTGRC